MLLKSSHINFLIWCLMAIVEGSLIFFQTDARALRTPVAARVDQVKLLLAYLVDKPSSIDSVAP
jgi:hypothetical protein